MTDIMNPNKKLIEFGNGPYIIKLDEKGVKIRDLGWATLQIEGKIVKVVCDDTLINNENIRIFQYTMSNNIPSKYYEQIGIYLSRGFNGMYAYNFSALHVFQKRCKEYFEKLDKELFDL